MKEGDKENDRVGESFQGGARTAFRGPHSQTVSTEASFVPDHTRHSVILTPDPPQP